MTLLWLRAETKKNEQRSALTPGSIQTLLNAGFQITVEKSHQRIFADSDFTGVTLVEEGTWANHRDRVPKDAIILGLKELPEGDTSPLTHTHIFFAHCFKRQAGWRDILARFEKGSGTLLDLEFLCDEKGRRVAAFGYHAGFAGAALGLKLWALKVVGKVLGPVKPYDHEGVLIDELKGLLASAQKQPKVLVMGALGRCGTGACDLLKKVGLSDANIIRWDMAETAKGGPFPEIAQADIFVNCIYLSKPIPKFMTLPFVDQVADRRLSVVVDVSCDTTNPHNPIPIYDVNTTFDNPTLHVTTPKGHGIDVISIDHLPSMLPRESSESFVQALLPSLLELNKPGRSRVWNDAETLFRTKLQESKLPEEK
jgi:saccharopine dehydrogenase (NAD+, L-lysine-forming)